jgi:outer membrane lipoprotein-sorting protein
MQDKLFLVILCLPIFILSCGKQNEPIPEQQTEQKAAKELIPAPAEEPAKAVEVIPAAPKESPEIEPVKEAKIDNPVKEQPAPSVEGFFKEMQERFSKINDYQCVFEAFVAKDDKSDKKVYKYFFKKDKNIRMEITEGENTGVKVVYSGEKVKVKPTGLIVSLFTFSFLPTDSTVCDLRGFGVHQSDWGTFIEEHLQYAKKSVVKSVTTEKVGEKETALWEIESLKPEETMSIAREKIWVDNAEKVIVKFEQYDKNGALMRSNSYKDVKINQNLADELFRKP